MQTKGLHVKTPTAARALPILQGPFSPRMLAFPGCVSNSISFFGW